MRLWYQYSEVNLVVYHPVVQVLRPYQGPELWRDDVVKSRLDSLEALNISTQWTPSRLNDCLASPQTILYCSLGVSKIVTRLGTPALPVFQSPSTQIPGRRAPPRNDAASPRKLPPEGWFGNAGCPTEKRLASYIHQVPPSELEENAVVLFSTLILVLKGFSHPSNSVSLSARRVDTVIDRDLEAVSWYKDIDPGNSLPFYVAMGFPNFVIALLHLCDSKLVPVWWLDKKNITRYLSETLKEEALSANAENERATLVRRVTILFPDDSLLPGVSRPYLDMNGRSQKRTRFFFPVKMSYEKEQERLRKLLEELSDVDSDISELSDSDYGESDYCEENVHQSDSVQSDCNTDKRASERARKRLGGHTGERASERPHQWRNGTLHSIAFDWEIKVRRLSELKSLARSVWPPPKLAACNLTSAAKYPVFTRNQNTDGNNDEECVSNIVFTKDLQKESDSKEEIEDCTTARMLKGINKIIECEHENNPVKEEHFDGIEVGDDLLQEDNNVVSLEGLRYVARKYRSKYPDLGTSYEETSENNWIKTISKGGLREPSYKLFKAIQLAEQIFIQIHGDFFSKEDNILKMATEAVMEKTNEIPREMTSCAVADENEEPNDFTSYFFTSRGRPITSRSYSARRGGYQKRVCGVHSCTITIAMPGYTIVVLVDMHLMNGAAGNQPHGIMISAPDYEPRGPVLDSQLIPCVFSRKNGAIKSVDHSSSSANTALDSSERSKQLIGVRGLVWLGPTLYYKTSGSDDDADGETRQTKWHVIPVRSYGISQAQDSAQAPSLGKRARSAITCVSLPPHGYPHDTAQAPSLGKRARFVITCVALPPHGYPHDAVCRCRGEGRVGNHINLCRDRGLKPGPPAQKSDSLPLDRQVTYSIKMLSSFRDARSKRDVIAMFQGLNKGGGSKEGKVEEHYKLGGRGSSRRTSKRLEAPRSRKRNSSFHFLCWLDTCLSFAVHRLGAAFSQFVVSCESGGRWSS
uniref:Uncharacterized protein n=1 Tax=Timema douglasi TaxID=61478 RepID=A0A7R8Z5Y6_TIMDO|nr:unnamed protein product [Timema douglasi]